MRVLRLLLLALGLLLSQLGPGEPGPCSTRGWTPGPRLRLAASATRGRGSRKASPGLSGLSGADGAGRSDPGVQAILSACLEPPGAGSPWSLRAAERQEGRTPFSLSSLPQGSLPFALGEDVRCQAAPTPPAPSLSWASRKYPL
ncbi:hypothetical protein G4228_018289 [Cervus hanglu yarkandensis]|nr:hypothetical protein G4228_018289 [Cervus hanglu yarkandensis]